MSDKSKKILIISIIVIAIIAVIVVICCNSNVEKIKNNTEENVIIPSCIFTEPEIAFVGLTEEKAKEAGYQTKTFKFPFAANGKALTLSESEGFVKVVADATYGEILGVHMIGSYASEIIYGAAAMVAKEQRVSDVQKIVFPHPTVCEVIREAMFTI